METFGDVIHPQVMDDEMTFKYSWWQVTPGYIIFVGLWASFFYPPLQDIALLVYYFVYELIGSTDDVYIENHLNGWTIWAIGEGALSVGTIAYYIYLFIARYTLDIDVFSDTTYILAFMLTNTVNLVLPFAKYAMIYYESSLPEDSCGIFDCFWSMNTEFGNQNVDVEMYPDVFKAASLLGNYVTYYVLFWVNEWMMGQMEFYE